MELECRPVNRKNARKVRKIYLDSFEKDDRMPYFLMRMMAKLWHTKLLSFYDGETLCGFLYLAVSKKLVFVMFFAVEESLRGKGYGSRILERLSALYPQKKIIVTIEKCERGAPDLEERQRRKKFYLNNGYRETGYLIKMGKEQEVLVKNGTFLKQEFFRFFLWYSNFTVMPKIWKPAP